MMRKPLFKGNKFANWKVGDKYELKKRLGAGSYGQVALAEEKATGKKVAIKRMKDVFFHNLDAKRMLRELVLLRQLKHPCVVELLDIIEPVDRENFNEIYIKF